MYSQVLLDGGTKPLFLFENCSPIWRQTAQLRSNVSSNGMARTRQRRDAVEVLSFSFGSIAGLSSRLGDRAGGKIGLMTAMIGVLQEPPPRYAALWSVAVGAAVAPVATT